MTSDPQASLGKRILLMKHGPQSINNLVKFLCVRSQASRGTTHQSKDKALSVSVSVSVSVSRGWQGRQSPRRDSRALCPASNGRVLVFLCVRWYPNGTSLICLFEPWRRQPCAGLPSPRQAGRRIRDGLPTLDKHLKVNRGALHRCSLPNTRSSRNLAAACRCHNTTTQRSEGVEHQNMVTSCNILVLSQTRR